MLKNFSLIIFISSLFLFTALAAPGDINPVPGESFHFGWNDLFGFLDWKPGSTNIVSVKSNHLEGKIVTSIGDIYLDCATAKNTSCASAEDWSVKKNLDSLCEYGWNDLIGWIKFASSCNPLEANHWGVSLIPADSGTNRFFDGFAWNDVVGWISLSSDNDHDTAAGIQTSSSVYKVKVEGTGVTSVKASLESNIFDTNFPAPSWNYILWQGSLAGSEPTSVSFILLSSDSSAGPWDFSSLSAVTLRGNPGEKIFFPSDFPKKRYLKYQALLMSLNGISPIIDDFIINWSP
ncbi:MAG: hypothetical protein FJY91_00890 [Candidatus Harrisonbacteria bacterium]|nr:hypothetical protein [Candidatus Harrisonbacteria bacterium]